MARPTIKSINSIKSLGIFHSFKKTDQIDFKEKTIVYGWNGTGKSTLARLFRALETKQPLEEFPKAEFEIELSDGSKIKHNTLSASNLNMRVFNKQFVDANINWDETVEKILLLSEENIEARKKMEHHKNNLQKLEENLKNEKNKAEVAEKEISKFCTTAAKNIKNSLIVIATDDTYFMNYDKTKFSRLLENQADLLKLGTCQMSEEELKNKLVSAQPNKKAEITTDDLSLEKSLYEEHYNKVVEIISRSVTASVIEEFRDNSELSTWVQTGLEIHRQNNSTVCEFCGSTIPANRLEELEKHFSDNYRKLIDDIDTETAILKTLEPKDYQLEKNDLYEELKEDYHVLCKQLNQQMDAFKEIIINWQDKLIEKKLAPFDKIEIISEGFLSAIETINITLDKIKAIINKHNKKCKDFEIIIKSAKEALELHFASEQIEQFNYYVRKENLNNCLSHIEHLKNVIKEEKRQITSLESVLFQEVLGAAQFNEKLASFLGYREITLVFDKQQNGYRIQRGESGDFAQNLSEGEKTAIAFIYFITKLEENGNRIEDSVVVIDDPISSFDSNHVFHAYAFLRDRCDKAAQLIVLTHNHAFYKLVRKWFCADLKIKDNILVIETYFQSGVRCSEIRTASKTFINSTTEYDYVFQKLYDYRNESILSGDDFFIAANLSRRLVETILGFKYPKHRGNLYELIKSATGDNVLRREKIYRFTNVFSHSQGIDLLGNDMDIMISESGNVIQEIFEMIKEVDENHYNEMCAMIQR